MCFLKPKEMQKFSRRNSKKNISYIAVGIALFMCFLAFVQIPPLKWLFGLSSFYLLCKGGYYFDYHSENTFENE